MNKQLMVMKKFLFQLFLSRSRNRRREKVQRARKTQKIVPIVKWLSPSLLKVELLPSFCNANTLDG